MANVFVNYALRNMARNKLRTVMTIAGAGIGIAVFVALMTISRSIQNQLYHIIDGYQIDITIQAKGAANPIGSRISMATVREIGRIPGIQSASGVVVGSKRLRWSQYFVILGADASEPLLRRFPIIEGSLFGSGKKEVIVGTLLARKRKLTLGQTLSLDKGQDYVISGIYSTGSRLFDGAAVMDLHQAMTALAQPDMVNMVMAQRAAGFKIDTVLQRLNQDYPGLQAERGFDFISEIRILKTVDTFASAIALISLIACCIVVTNTLLMAITERTREFGILMAIGWNRWMILKTIVMESSTTCLLGSVVGNLLSLVFLFILNREQLVGIGWVPVVPSLSIVLGAMGLGMLLGLISSFYPGLVALRMQPVSALGYEQ